MTDDPNLKSKSEGHNSYEATPPRRYERCQIDAPVACLRPHGLCFETVVEISEGGLLMLIHHDYKIGEILDLRFFIPGQVSIALRGEIVYIVDSLSLGPIPSRHAGVRFVETPATLASSIRSYIQRASRPL